MEPTDGSASGKEAGPGGRGAASPAADPSGELYRAIRRDFDGLVEVCRWQWNLIERLRGELNRLPTGSAGGTR
ncbi:MAG: hypothetical protein BIFFINMI_02526 [Phycisphaerae bacterium]|nr:hypothetical protein [Phycisphaerae bacterium]